MKVNAWKNLDVEFEADVSLDDCINEMLDIAHSEDGPNRKLIAIDGATRILERVSPDMVAVYLEKYPKSRELIRSRLNQWMVALNQ